MGLESVLLVCLFQEGSVKRCSVCEDFIWYDRSQRRWWHAIHGPVGRCTKEEYLRQMALGCFNKAKPKR